MQKQQQVTQQLGKGQIEVRDVPVPAVGPRDVLVANHFSLISGGTETSTVRAARASLIGKAKARPEQVRQVLRVMKTQGLKQTIRAVSQKLDAYSPLGYSSSGRVIGVGLEVTTVQVGDYVACAGNSANHAEIVSVPETLTVRLPQGADTAQAAYNALGAIALQGIRRADLTIGEKCVVIGAGLIGQLTGLLLKAAGIEVIGIDVDARTVAQAAQNAAFDHVRERNDPGVEAFIRQRTGGLGADAVIITAGTSSLDPINFSGRITRKRGTVVVVGAVPTGFDREHYYRKELDLRMSCSYGPGRYDSAYEDLGRDYPAAWVRWTEKRNMIAFQELVANGHVNVATLSTHVLPVERAADAYELLMQRTEPALGVLLEYSQEKVAPAGREVHLTRAKRTFLGQEQSAGIGLIGAGSYCQGYLLPSLKNLSAIELRGVATASGTTAQRVADRWGFSFAASTAQEVLEDDKTHAVVIATRHDSHAAYTCDVIRSGRAAYVEKPLSINTEGIEAIAEALQSTPGAMVMVGFNRRFSPAAQKLKARLSPQPLSATYTINAGSLPDDHWTRSPEVGGGRIIGECCHFIDLLTFLSGELPREITATASPSPGDSWTIAISFSGGSVASINYFTDGPATLAKENLKVLQAGRAWEIDDFRRLLEFGPKPRTLWRSRSQDKGQRKMMHCFVDAVRNAQPAPITFEELRSVTLATIAAEKARAWRAVVELDNEP